MIWIVEGSIFHTLLERTFLVDSVTEIPLPCPAFECADDAQGCLAWSTLTTAQWLASTRDELIFMHAAWTKLRCNGCYQLDCACQDCGARCIERCKPECSGEVRP